MQASEIDIRQEPAAEQPAKATRRSGRWGDSLIHAVMALLLLSAWQISRMGLFGPGDDISYWIAVTGAIMMLLVFLYPLRKYLRPFHRLGAVKWWLWMHLAFGLVGPWLILVHSTFRIGSLNAGVALFSMVIVVLSGVVGRFLYVRVHRGLDGERTTLRELQVRAGFVESDARSRLHFAPDVEAKLQAFEEQVLKTDRGWRGHLTQLFVLPFRQWNTQRKCKASLEEALIPLAERRNWTTEELAKRRRHSRKLVRRYLMAVVRVAQFTAYERAFALWHVAHLPFVYLLVISAIIHVVAVHAY